MRLLPLLLLAAFACAADSAIADAARTALAGDDPYAKREAVKALAGKDGIDDDTAYTLIIQAVGDRQAHDAAVAAFRARSGLNPPSGKMGSSQYPGYPASDDAAGFTAWNQARTKEAEQKKKLDDLTKKPAPGKPTEDKPTEDKPADAPPPPRIPTDSLGKLDRIVYKSGRSLIAFIRSKRTDAEGHLVSIRVVHKDGDGEEVIDMAQVARIEEDIE